MKLALMDNQGPKSSVPVWSKLSSQTRSIVSGADAAQVEARVLPAPHVQLALEVDHKYLVVGECVVPGDAAPAGLDGDELLAATGHAHLLHQTPAQTPRPPLASRRAAGWPRRLRLC